MANYDEFAELYAKRSKKIEQKTRDKFYSLLPTLDGKLLLDVGCGSGQDAFYYAKKGAKVSGVDISAEEIKIAKTNLKKTDYEINFQKGDMNELPYESNTFDVVTSWYALQASNDVTHALTEMIRVAKPGSLVAILTKHPFRQLVESFVNNKNGNYLSMGAQDGKVTSKIFNGDIVLHEPGHTQTEYLHSDILKIATLEYFNDEGNDFPASDKVIKGMTYSTYEILQFRKK